MMGGIFTWLLIGAVIYLLISKKGGMVGCCGGHGGHDRHSPQNPGHSAPRSGFSLDPREEIIDLKEKDYSVHTRR